MVQILCRGNEYKSLSDKFQIMFLSMPYNHISCILTLNSKISVTPFFTFKGKLLKISHNNTVNRKVDI